MKTKKLLALLLTLVMVVGLLPVGAMADDDFHLIIDLTGYFGKINGAETASIELNVMGNINTVTIKPNTKNDIVLPQNSTLNGTIILNLDDFTYDNEDISKSWKIDGITESTEKNTFSLVEQTAKIEIKSKNMLGMSSTAITIQESQISFKSDWAIWSAFNQAKNLPNKTIIITPIFASGSGVTATAVSSSAEQGSAAAFTASGENEWIINATPNDGYSFHYWLRDNDADTAENRITENPYTVTLDADATFTAYFRERYTLTAESEDTAKGTAVAQYTGASNGVDNYTLTATPADYYAFDKWTCGNDEYIDNPLDVSVSESGKTYTAHFSPLALSLEDGAAWKLVGSTANAGIANTFVGSKAGIPSVGSRCALFLPVSIPGAMEHVSIALSVADGQGQTLGEYTSEDVTFDYAFSGYIDVRFDPAPAVSSVTATLSLTTPAGTCTSTKTYSGLTLADGAENDDYLYVTSPGFGYGDISIVDCGPNLYGAYGRTDAATGAAELYVYGQQGVFSYDPAGRPNLVNMGLTVPQGARVTSLGGNGATGLTAAVVSADNVILYAWTGTDWTPIEGGSAKDEKLSSGGGVLVLDETDVWTALKHWNGESWTEHTYNFKSFSRSADAVYATDGSGQRWKYSDGAWTTAAEAPSADSVTGGGAYKGIGQDHKGDWYLFMEGRSHFVSDSTFYGYQGSDVYKWDGSKWVYQIISEFNDPNDRPATEDIRRIRPDGVNGVCVPMPGVSVMYGTQGRGALYLSTDNVTITFNPGEGRILGDAALTAPIFSEIDMGKVPGALLAGRDFGGWFYDAAYKIAFDASVVMPGADVTVYAKWTEKEGLTDELAFYRERALASLEQQYKKYSSANYSAENWTKLQKAYNDGKTAINAATVGTDRVDENIAAALTAASEAMAAIPTQAPQKQDITVAVSMDANTLGLGYLIEPTLVTVPEGTQASVVITNLIKQMAAEKFGVTSDGYTTYHESEPAAQYPWMMTGSVTQDFYLAQVYYPAQQSYKLPSFLASAIGGLGFDDSDKDGNYLGEFDYLNTSGWVYSIGDKSSGNASFPGIGASGWNLSDGEVMRWQFTLAGYGADVNADNTQWGTQSMIPTLGDKSALTWKVAEINDAGTKNTYGDDYDKAIAVLTDAEATQKQVDDALAALNKQDGGNASAGGTGKKDKTYQITVAATENGTATVSAATASEGEKITVTAKPADGYTLDSITVKGEKAGSVEVKDGAFTMPADDVTVTVKFKKAEGKAKQTFTDVKPEDWFYEGVEFVSEKGWMQGPGGGVFQPNETTTRAMVAQVIWNMAGKPAASAASPFADVAEGAWYADAVRWAAEKGVVTGWTDENGRQVFDPDGKVTREQFAAMLYRYAKTLGKGFTGLWSYKLDFPDAGDVSDWATEAMSWMVMQGVINGMDGRLNPQGVSTRAQVATMIQRLAGLIEN